MGSGPSLADNEEEETSSGAGRLCGSIICAVCVAPILILAMVAMVGYNEQQAVCDAKALESGSKAVQQIGCTSKAEQTGELVLFQCDVQKGSPQTLTGGGDFSGTYTGVGLKVRAEMLQCVEHKESKTSKNSVGGGKTTINTYTYSKKWKDSYENSQGFAKLDSGSWRDNCGVHNPEWSQAGLPTSGSTYDTEITVGPYKVISKIDRIPLDTTVSSLTTGRPGWTKSGDGFSKGSGSKIGDARVSFYTNDWSQPAVTVVGKNDNGQITPWKAPGAWLCSGNHVSALKPGKVTKEGIFKHMKDEVTMRTWIFRAVGFLILWFAFSLCFGPFEVAADCIPCIGPWIGDCLEAVGCCLACCPATICFLGVAGAVWVAMRPLIGIPLMLLWIVCVVGAAYYFANRRSRKGDNSEPLLSNAAPTYGVAAPPAQYGIPTAQAVPPPRQMQVVVPDGVSPGSMIQVQTPEGVMTQVAVPEGSLPGSVFLMNY